LKTRKKK